MNVHHLAQIYAVVGNIIKRYYSIIIRNTFTNTWLLKKDMFELIFYFRVNKDQTNDFFYFVQKT